MAIGVGDDEKRVGRHRGKKNTLPWGGWRFYGVGRFGFVACRCRVSWRWCVGCGVFPFFWLGLCWLRGAAVGVSCRCVAVLGRGSFLLAWSCVWLPFLSVCRGAAGLGFSLSFSLVGRRKKGGAVLPGGGCVPPLGGVGFAGAAAGAARFAAAGGSFFGARGFLRGAWVPLGFCFPLAGLAGWRFFLLGRRARAWFLSFGLVGVAALGGRKAPTPRPPPPPLRSRVVWCWRPPLLCRGFVGWVWAVPAFLAVWGGACWVLGSFSGRLVVAAMGCVAVLCGRVPRRAILLCRHRSNGRARLLPAIGNVVQIKHLENLFARMV